MTTSNQDYVALIRAHLQDKSATELTDLLLELIREVDEPTRQRFWRRVAPPGIATADLRYPTPEIFLAALDEFVDEVEAGEHFDEGAQEYYSLDTIDRAYHDLTYDPEDHTGFQALRRHLEEADSYFRAGRYAVAAEAYQRLIRITLNSDPFKTLGIDDPLRELGRDKEQLAERYFLVLRESRTTDEFFEQAINFLARNDQPYHNYTDRFLALVGPERREALHAYLDRWADALEAQDISTQHTGIPFQLQLSLRVYEEAGQTAAAQALRHRFRRRFTALYVPLLADREAAQDWAAVIYYGREVLESIASAPTPSRRTYLLPGQWPTRVDPAIVRAQMARAFEATGDPVNAFAIYRPVFDAYPDFDRYTEARRLAGLIDPQRAQAFTDEALAHLRQGLPRWLYLICQIYLSEGNFDEAYALVENSVEYSALNAVKLVAKAHLLAGLGPQPTPKIGRLLREIYAKIEEVDKEPVRFLHERRPGSQDLPRDMALARAESLYRQLMQIHIDRGRKTYVTAAYYCRLLGEIAAHEDRLPAFVQFYDDLIRRYARHRALRAELEAEVRPLLKGELE